MRRSGPPALHFLAMGVALFALERAAVPRRPPGPPAPAAGPLLTPDRLAQLRADFTRQEGTPPTPEQEQALAAQAIDDEILYRESLVRRLDRDDPSIRYRLAEKMRFLADGNEDEGHEERFYRDALALHLDREDLFIRRMLTTKMRLLAERAEDDPAPDETALQAHLDRHADRYREPERTSLWHVFVSSARGAAGGREARALLAELRREATPPTTSASRGDPFPFGAHVRAASPRDLAKQFGEPFAASVARLPVGEWAGPVASSYGLHLVLVEAREPGRVPPLAAVRARVLAEVREERRRERLAAAMAALRAKYGVAPGGPGQESRG
ncbi:MAG: peptidyl-prolyl cis-trans isomerase [Deltaproteobacteria bacterium]|nr:MAG: peptidyl-prolyl cis-trans isomerase [Deltaproteobacteria bacterium]